MLDSGLGLPASLLHFSHFDPSFPLRAILQLENDAIPMYIFEAVLCDFSDGCAGAGHLVGSSPVGNR
jgi:hypothetical protein